MTTTGTNLEPKDYFTGTIRTKYSGGEIDVLFIVSHYVDDRSPALKVLSKVEGEPILTASVAVGVQPAPGNIILKDWSENEGIVRELIKAGLISQRPVRAHPTGFVVAEEYAMQGELLEAWNNHKAAWEL